MQCGETANSLSEEVTKFNTGGDAPYRMAIHPSGRTLILGMTMGGVMAVDIEPSTSGRVDDPPVLSRARGEPVLGFVVGTGGVADLRSRSEERV